MSLHVTFSIHFYTSAIEAVGYSGKQMVKTLKLSPPGLEMSLPLFFSIRTVY